MFRLYSIVTEKTQIQYKRKQKNLFVAKAIEAKVWLLVYWYINVSSTFVPRLFRGLKYS